MWWNVKVYEITSFFDVRENNNSCYHNYETEKNQSVWCEFFMANPINPGPNPIQAKCSLNDSPGFFFCFLLAIAHSLLLLLLTMCSYRTQHRKSDFLVLFGALSHRTLFNAVNSTSVLSDVLSIVDVEIHSKSNQIGAQSRCDFWLIW